MNIYLTGTNCTHYLYKITFIENYLKKIKNYLSFCKVQELNKKIEVNIYSEPLCY